MENRTTISAPRTFVRDLSRMSSTATVGLGFALTLAAGLLDYVTGPTLASLTFYLGPVALVAWVGARWQGILCGVVAGALWAFAEAARGRDYDSEWVFIWNSLTRLVVFLVIALLLHRNSMTSTDANAGSRGATCPNCGSTDTVALRMGLVCQKCKRLS